MAAPRRNTPALKGMPAQGSRPASKGGVVPNGQYPTVIGTKNAPGTGAPYVPNPGKSTVNSTPAKG
jgi:hypothetical protein